MKSARFISSGVVCSGVVEGQVLVDSKGNEYRMNEVRFLPPVEPSKIIGLVLNYSDHADELGLSPGDAPVVFIKPQNTLIGHLEDIIYPEGVEFLHYEGELAVVIGKRARKVKSAEAMDYVGGYTVANDVTARDFITNTFRPPVKAKGFDTFCPLGPYLADAGEVDISRGVEIRTELNGRTVQSSNTGMFIHDIPSVIEYLSAFMTLNQGDVILTGTPRGISRLTPGDRIDVTVSGIGTLTNMVAPEHTHI